MRRYCILLLFVVGCATLGGGERKVLPDAVLHSAQTCVENSASGCTVLMVDNGQLEDAGIYLYGGRIGTVTGMKTSPLFIPNVMLHAGALCAVISARLQHSRQLWQSREECLQPGGGHFALVIAPLFSASTLTPW